MFHSTLLQCVVMWMCVKQPIMRDTFHNLSTANQGVTNSVVSDPFQPWFTFTAIQQHSALLKHGSLRFSSPSCLLSLFNCEVIPIATERSTPVHFTANSAVLLEVYIRLLYPIKRDQKLLKKEVQPPSGGLSGISNKVQRVLMQRFREELLLHVAETAHGRTKQHNKTRRERQKVLTALHR